MKSKTILLLILILSIFSVGCNTGINKIEFCYEDVCGAIGFDQEKSESVGAPIINQEVGGVETTLYTFTEEEVDALAKKLEDKEKTVSKSDIDRESEPSNYRYLKEKANEK